MNDFQEEYFRKQEDQIQRRYDPAIRLIYNPRIERWLVCEDLRIARKRSDPWVPRDSDLEGAPGIGEMTTLVALFKCECSDGKTFPPLADLVIKILAIEHPRNGDKPATKFLKNAEDKKEARWRRALHDKQRQVYDDALALRMYGRRVDFGRRG